MGNQNFAESVTGADGSLLSVREALPGDDASRILELLPEATERANVFKLLVAVHPATMRVEAAGLIRRSGYPARHYLLIRPGGDDAGGGAVVTALAKAATALAAESGVRDVYCWDTFSPSDPAAGRYLDAGFVVSEKAVFYEAGVAASLADLEPLYGRLRRNNKIPARAAAGRLSEQDLDEVFALHVEEFACDPHEARQRLAGESAECNYSRELSTVLTLGGKVIGVFLAYEEESPDVAFIYGVAVARGLRGTWANAFLKYSAFEHLARRGVGRVRLRAARDSRDTHKHAARARATVMEERWELSRRTGS